MRIMSMHLENSPNDGRKKLHLTNLYLSFRLPSLCTLQMQYLAFLLSTKDGIAFVLQTFWHSRQDGHEGKKFSG